MSIPKWAAEAVFYQIFPDRFHNGDPNNDPPNVQPWTSLPRGNSFHGGDLEGIRRKLDYLQDLGVNALYLTPIFQATSNHRYNTTNYYQIDPKLGGRQDFRSLLNDAHSRNIKIVLDGVFNHCGRGFFAFNDVLENQSSSAYKDWFTIKRFPVDAYSPGEAKDYLGWWNYKSLPKLNLKNPATRAYILGVAEYWLQQGMDGWRLDVPNEIDDDEFWAEFRFRVKNINPEAILIGEIWDINPRWVDGRHFDSLMNYPFREAILKWLNAEIGAEEFITRIQAVKQAYAWDNLLAMYNLLGSHDTERVITALRLDVEKVKLAFLALFCLPGSPAVYYGDEIGMPGGKDPDCRRCFPWIESQWNAALRSWVKTLIAQRNTHPALKTGSMEINLLDQSGCVIIQRAQDDDLVFAILNPKDGRAQIGLDSRLPGGRYIDLVTSETMDLSPENGVEVSPHAGRLLQKT